METSARAGGSCFDENLLAAFAEGRLDVGPRDAIEAHLADCGDCRAVVAQTAGTTSSNAPSSGNREEAEPTELAPGTHVGRYVVERLVGHGAMGAVYSARDPDLDRRVAVKLLRAESLSDGARRRMRTRLLREAKAMARLSHPEVITVHDVGPFSDQVFVAMEYVEGETLREWRAARHRSFREILEVYERAGSGLAAAHDAGLVHRDFKPDNVLVGKDGRVRVTDFGLARGMDGNDSGGSPAREVETDDDRAWTTTLTRTGTILGTPAYMAPEQLCGAAADARSDVFSFCVSLYEALYGERPFDGLTVVALRTAIEAGTVRAAPMMTRVPGWVRTALLRGLDATPERRFASMRGVLDALRADHERSRRRRAAIGWSAVAMGLLGVLVAAGAARSVRGPERRTTASVSPSSPPSTSSEPPSPAASGTAATLGELPPTQRALAIEPRPASSDARPVATARPPGLEHVPSTHTTRRERERPRLVGNNGALILE